MRLNASDRIFPEAGERKGSSLRSLEEITWALEGFSEKAGGMLCTPGHLQPRKLPEHRRVPVPAGSGGDVEAA